MKEESPKKISPLPASATRSSPSVPGRNQRRFHTKAKSIDETSPTCPCIRWSCSRPVNVRRSVCRNVRHRPRAYLGRIQYLALFPPGARLFWQAEGDDLSL